MSFRYKTNYVTGQQTKLHNENPYNFYTSPDGVRAIKSK